MLRIERFFQSLGQNGVQHFLSPDSGYSTRIRDWRIQGFVYTSHPPSPRLVTRISARARARQTVSGSVRLFISAPAPNFPWFLSKHPLFYRYRATPTFNQTIRKFSSNASQLTRRAARDYEDLLQVNYQAQSSKHNIDIDHAA